MTAFKTTSRVGPDGRLHLDVPSMANTEVRVTVEPVNASGTNGAPRSMGDAEWKLFIDAFAGSMPDFPDIPRPGPESYEQREWLD